MTEDKKWLFKENTVIKHRLLEKYLRPWIRILGKKGRIIYFDCCAGRGCDKEGKEGSPLIALKIAKEESDRFSEFVALFCETNPDNCENLKKEIEKLKLPQKIKYCIEKGDYILKIQNILNETDNLAPSFFFIDPYGFNVPMDLITQILTRKRTEVFINFMYEELSRFVALSQNEQLMNKFFGCEDWKKCIKLSGQKRENCLKELYLEQLRKSAEYVIDYKIGRADMQRTKYYLFHSTNKYLGFKIMKEVMYRTGTIGEFAYKGPHEGQMSIEKFNQKYDLPNLLCKEFKGKTISYEDGEKWVNLNTKLIDKHYKVALKNLLAENKIRISKLGPRGGIPQTADIEFF